VIQTFKLTDSPRRFKPIDIYYHFYSGSKIAALKALQTVFDWALRQEVIRLFTTEYIQKVMEYYDVSLSREEGGWRIAGMRHLRTLRLSDRMPAVDLEKSRELLGMRRVETRRYLALTGEGDPRIVLDTNALEKSGAYLLQANAPLKGRDSEGGYHFVGHVPLEIVWHLVPGCRLETTPIPEYRERKGAELFLKYSKAREATIHVRCRP
jgi:hypothetical protein